MSPLNRPVDDVPDAVEYGDDDIVSRLDYVHCTIIFLVVFLGYIWSAPGTVGLEDDGYFILTAYYNGIAHPPGYPLHTLLAHVATLIPVGSVALRVHLLSGLLGALACACLWCIARKLVRDRVAAYAAALSLAFSSVYWSQAIIAKGIYTLNVLLMLMAFICVLALRDGVPGRGYGRYIKLLFLCYGLALSNHWPLVILTTPMIIAALWRVRGNYKQIIAVGFPFLLLGLTPYLWMAVRSQMNPEIVFFGPIETVRDFWHYLSRQPYAVMEYSPSAGWIDKLQYIKYVLLQTGEQYGPFGWFFVLAGLVNLKRKLPPDLCLALILGFLGSSVFLALLLGFDYEEYHKEFFSVYPLISYAIASLWLGLGLASIVALLMNKKAPQSTRKLVATGLSALVVISAFSVNAGWNYRHDDDWARLYAVTILDSLPRGAILFTDGIAEGAIAYMNKIEGYRPDIDLYSMKGVLLKNRLYHPMKSSGTEVGKAFAEFIKAQDRPIYDLSGRLSSYAEDYYGLYSRVSGNVDKTTASAIVLPALSDYWRIMLEQRPRHPWEKFHRTTMLANGCHLLTMIDNFHIQNRTDNAQWRYLRDRLCDNLPGSYIRIKFLMNRDMVDWNMIRLFLSKAEKQLSEALLKSDISQLDYYRGIMYLNTGDTKKGRYHLEQSLLKWNHPENQANDELRRLIN